MVPILRSETYLGVKRLFHFDIQRKPISDESDKALLKSISNLHQVMRSNHYEGNSDLESTLAVIYSM